MAAISLADIRRLGVPILWQEAVAVVSEADRLSSTQDTSIAPEHCWVTAEGDVRLSPTDSVAEALSLSSLELLILMLEGQASASDLRVLATTIDGRAPAECRVNRRLRVDLNWCLSPDPRADVARLAQRALAQSPLAETASDATRQQPGPAGTLTAPVASIGLSSARRRVAVTVRVQAVSRGAALAMAGTLLLGVSSAVAVSAVVSGTDRRPQPSDTQRHFDPLPRTQPAVPVISSTADAASTGLVIDDAQARRDEVADSVPPSDPD